MFRIYLFVFVAVFCCCFSEVKSKKSHKLQSSESQKFANILRPNKPRCTDKRLHKTDRQMVRLLSFGPKGRPFPDSIPGMRQYCNETMHLLSEIESFNRECFKPEIASLTKVFLYSVRSSFVRHYCGKNIRKSEKFTKISSCLNRVYFSKSHCFETYTDETSKLVNLPNDKIKFPYLCCNFIEFINCQGKILDSSSCTAQFRDELLDVIRRSTAGIVDIACGEYIESNDRCEKLGPSPSAPNNKHYDSHFLALADLVASMKSFQSSIPE